MEASEYMLISDYLADSLDDEAKTAFEKRIQEDPAFADEYRQQRTQLDIFKAIGRAEQKASLKKQLLQAQQKQASVRRLWMGGVVTALAAAILLLLTLPGIFSKGAEDLALTYLDTFPASQARAAQAPGDSLQAQAMDLYQAGAYQRVAPMFLQIAQAKPDEPIWLMYHAESLAQLGRYREAAKTYASISDTVAFYDVVQWKLALNQLLAGQKKEAVALLKELKGSNHFRSAQAAQLLKKL